MGFQALFKFVKCWRAPDVVRETVPSSWGGDGDYAIYACLRSLYKSFVDIIIIIYYINLRYITIVQRQRRTSPETVKWSMKSRSWINNLCLQTGPITDKLTSRD